MTDFDIITPLSGQLAACLNTLEKVISNANDTVWRYGKPPFWQIAFHVINSLDAYFITFKPNVIKPDEEYSLPPNLAKYETFGFFDNDPAELEENVIESDELLGFLNTTRGRIRRYFKQGIQDQFSKVSGFPWIPFTKYELILHNLRHTAGHIGILDQMLKSHGLKHVGWLGRGEI